MVIDLILKYGPETDEVDLLLVSTSFVNRKSRVSPNFE